MRNPLRVYEEVCLKLAEYCSENNLDMQIDKSKYPMVISFNRQDAPLLEGVDSEIIIQFKFGEELYIEMDNAKKIGISDTVFNKLRSMSKKACHFYMLYAFYMLNRYYGQAFEPMWTTAHGDVVGMFKREYLPPDIKRAPADPVKRME